MAESLITCPVCNFCVFVENGAINRARRAGLSVYCGRECAGVARRKHRSLDEKKALKSAYDAQRRIDLADRFRAEKAAYHKRTYDPVRAAAERKLKMPRHIEYCRRPEYREWKAEYDKRHLASKHYGQFGDAALVLRELEAEVLSRASRYDLDLTNNRLNKVQKRKRDYVQLIGR